MLGWQAAGSAPLVLGEPVLHPETIATAIRIGNPASWDAAIAARDESGGAIGSVTDAQILDAYRLLASLEGRVRRARVGRLGGRAAPGRGSRFARARRGCGVHGDRSRPQGPESGDRRDRAEAGGRRRTSSRCSPSSACERRGRVTHGRSVVSADARDRRRGRRRSRSRSAAARRWSRVTHGDSAPRASLAPADHHDRVDRPPRRRRRPRPRRCALPQPDPPPRESLRRRADHADRHHRDPEDRARASDLRRRVADRGRPRPRALAGLGACPAASATRCSPVTASRTRTRSSTSTCSRSATRSSSTCRTACSPTRSRRSRSCSPTEHLRSPIPTRTPTITLFACNPKHSAAQRIVVKGKLVSSPSRKSSAPRAVRTSTQ